MFGRSRNIGIWVGIAVGAVVGVSTGGIGGAKAEPLYKRALAIREKALGPDHPQLC